MMIYLRGGKKRRKNKAEKEAKKGGKQIVCMHTQNQKEATYNQSVYTVQASTH